MFRAQSRVFKKCRPEQSRTAYQSRCDCCCAAAYFCLSLLHQRTRNEMFQPSSQHLSLRQQVIALSQAYPCPRCTPGTLEPFGLTETLMCSSCRRGFVPLRGGRFLYPAQHLGWKIAPTFWWDGFRWHWGGTTATTRQLCTIVLMSLLPVIGMMVASTLAKGWWLATLPRWCDPALLAPIVGLITMQLIYLLCWDFDLFSRRPRCSRRTTAVE